MSRLALLSLALLLAVGDVAAQESAYTLVIKDHKFLPAEIEVPAGQKIALIVKNDDPTPEEFESNQLKREKVIPGGQRITFLSGRSSLGNTSFSVNSTRRRRAAISLQNEE